MSTVLVLGATATIGRALVRRLAADGYDLLLAGRNEKEMEAIASDARIRYGVHVGWFPFEARDLERHEATISKALSEVDRLAGAIVLVGTLGNEGAAQHDGEAAREILEVNFTGVVTAVTPLADALEAQGEGFLVVVSSVAGDRGRASNYVYGSAKAGLSAFAQGLRNRLHGSGVHVATVKPGFVDTKMTYGREGMFLVASPDRVARAIQRAGENRKDIVYVPWFWRPVMWLIRALPERIFKRLSL